MYSKQEAARMREQFWIAFGRYMKPVLSASGEQVNWVNYKTSVRHIFFRMDAGRNEAYIALELTHTDPADRDRCWQQLLSLQALFHTYAGKDWEWESDTTNEAGRTVSRVIRRLGSVTIYRQEDWPELISFLKPGIIALDRFWAEAKPVFEF